MNNTEAKNTLTELRDYCNFLTKECKKYSDQILDLQERILDIKGTRSEMAKRIKALDTELANEKSAKRSVMRLLKQYPQLELDDESDHSKGMRGTYLWLYGPFRGDDEKDPYHDEHYMDDWVECYQRCLTYVEIIKNNLSVTEET